MNQCIKPLALTSFGWGSMCAMLCTIARNHFIVTGIATQWKRNLNDVVASLHQHQNSLHGLLALLQTVALNGFDQFVFGNLAAPMEEIFDHIEETWICQNENYPVG